MRIDCPHGCGADFSMMETTCPSCQKPVGAADFVRLKIQERWYRFWGGKRRVFKADCPGCNEPVSLDFSACPSCGFEVGFMPMLNHHITPLVSAFVAIRERLNRTTPAEALAIRWGFLMVSIAVLGLLIGAVEDKFVNGNGNWITAGLATAIYLGSSLLVLTWIVPPQLASLLARLKVLTKFAFLVNYFSGVFVILLVTDHWRVRSWLLIGALFASVVGVWLASNILLPKWLEAGAIISGKLPQSGPTLPPERGPTRQNIPRRFS